VDEANHHPGQTLEVAQVYPMGMLAEHLHQRIIKMGCVLHSVPPRENGSLRKKTIGRGNLGEHISLLSVKQETALYIGSSVAAGVMGLFGGLALVRGLTM